MTFPEFATLISSVVASGTVTAGVLWLAREWIGARIKASVQHEYDQKLEALKAQWAAQKETALVALRADVERQAALVAAAHASFGEGQKAAMDRRLVAVETLWGALLDLRRRLPAVLGVIEVLTVKQFGEFKKNKTFESLIKDWPFEKVADLLDPQAERARPYVGEYAWAIFSSYQATMLRIVFLLHEGKDDASKVEWYKDPGTRRFIEIVLLPNELKEFDALQFGRMTWLQRQVESKILFAVRKVISGEEFSGDLLVQAAVIELNVAQQEAAKKAEVAHLTSPKATT